MLRFSCSGFSLPAWAAQMGVPASQDEETLRRSRFQRRHSFVMVKGAALLLQEEEEEPEGAPPRTPPLHKTHKRNKSAQAQDLQQRGHLQAMVDLLRPEDSIKLAVRLESVKLHRIRYLLVVSTMGCSGEDETILLGVDFPNEGCNLCTIGMVLPVWSNTQVFLDGDGGFSVTSDNETRIFKPISVQTMWSMMQVLHKACESAFHHNHFPASSAMGWVPHYQAAISSEQSCINEWMAMSDLLSVRPDSPFNFTDQPSEREIAEPTVKAKLREVMMSTDLETITSKEIRNELERRMNCNLKEYKEFIDNEMMMILAQMDRPSRIFDYLYLGSEWNASNLEELQKNGVGYILNVTREIDNFFPESLKYLNVRVYDEETTDLLPHWKETYRFISSARKQNSRVLVHCKMGISRSASTVIAYAMKEYGWSLEEALRHVKEKRSIVNPNPGFMRQLLIYQGILDASKQRHNDLWELKTKREELDRSVQEKRQQQEGNGGLLEETPQSHDKPSPIEEEEVSESEESDEEEDDVDEEELPKTPAYCFRPLEGLEAELDFLAVASPDGVPEEVPCARLDEEAQPTISVQKMEEEADEVGSTSDDSLAEEVMGHLEAPQRGQAFAVPSSPLAVPESPLTPRRQRINLWSVMRSISAMESLDLETPPMSPIENVNNNNNLHDSVFYPSPKEAPGRAQPPLPHGPPPPPPPPSSSENKSGGQPQATAPKLRGKKRLPRQSRAQMDKDTGSHSHRPHSAAKALARQKLVDKKLSKQVSYMPQAGKVRKQARVLDSLRHPPQGADEADWLNCDGAEETVEWGSVPAPRPRLKHLKSVAELRKAALVSRQTRALESGQRPLPVGSMEGSEEVVLLPGPTEADPLPALQGDAAPGPAFPEPTIGVPGSEVPPVTSRLERSMSGPKKMVRWENVEGEEPPPEVAHSSQGHDSSHKNGAS